MRRILVAATILAAACGGKPTIQATPEIKSTATTASQGMSSTSTSTQASIGLQALGSSVADTVANGGVATLDLSVGLSDPSSLAAGAMAPQPALSSQYLRASDPGATALTNPTGCVRRSQGPNSAPALVAPGTQGCTAAAGVLEVDYDNGDKVNITWTDNTTNFDLRVTVVAGPWNGTSLHFAGNVNASGATVTVDGTMQYSKVGSAIHIDADFQLSYTLTASGNSSAATVSIQVSGTATDHLAAVAGVRAHQGWTLTVQTSSNQTTQTATVDWNGGIGVDVFKADGVTVDHSVAFNLNLHVTSTTTGSTTTVTGTAGGDVDYDGAVCGNVVEKNNQLYVDWTDGTEDAFDASALLG
jgi:hypothetical protein